MTVTETKPEDKASSTDLVEYDPNLVPLPPPPPDGLVGALSTYDHKTTGRLYIGTSLLLLIGGLVLFALVDVERTTPDQLGTLLTDDFFFQVFTLSRVGVVLLGVLPLLLGIGSYVVPLQVGAPAGAFPRASALGYWTWALGSGLFVAGYLANGGFAGGSAEGVELALLALLLIIAGLSLTTIAVVATVTTMRAEGMTLQQVPAFSWSMLASGFIWLTTLGVLAGNVILIWVDYRYEQVLFGDAANQWLQVSWLFRLPAIYLLAIPVLGFIVDAVSTMSGQRPAPYGALLGTIGAFSILSFGAWAQTAFDDSITQEAVYIAVAVVIVLPVLAFTGATAAMMRTKPTVSAGLVHAVFALLLLLLSVVVGALYVIEPLNLVGTSWAMGHTKLVIGVGIVGGLGALQYWGGKIWGLQPPEALARLEALVLTVGVLVWAIPELITGLNDQVALGDVTGVVDDVSGASSLNGVAAVGGAIVAAGAVLALLNNLRPMLRKRTVGADADPHGGLTLEWATTSPPPHGNFREPLPPVRSCSPLLDSRVDGDGDMSDGLASEQKDRA